jgi:uncharacterized protein YjlB
MSQGAGAKPRRDRAQDDTGPADAARYSRPAALPGGEALHATFVTHRYAPHLHEAWTVAAVDHGAAAFDLEGRRHTAPSGTVFVIPPHAVHTGEAASPDGSVTGSSTSTQSQGRRPSRIAW